ncbi:MAG TPA: glycosyltransferase [Terriglobales bacterium]|jgi:sugar transferase (PEP-CTERM/EpsH1 system associated)|nr:glycosyltransferase [Terriglobales bacterium]
MSAWANKSGPQHVAAKMPQIVAGAQSIRSQTGTQAVDQSRALRILHVTNSMGLGGTEKVVLKLAGKLSEGFDHRVCCIRNYDSGLIRNALRPEQFMALDLQPSRFAFFVPALMKVIRACKPDIVHSRNWGAIEAVFAARLAGVPVVVHSEHGYDVDGLHKTSLRQRLIRRLAYSTADVVFTVTRELQEFHAACARIPASRIGVLYNGVDTCSFAPRPDLRARIRKAYGIGPEEFVIGAVGRMAAIKNYDTLVRAAGVLARHNLNFKLVLVGDGEQLASLSSLSQSLPGVAERILFLGQRDDVEDLLNAMDLFVQTSLREGMSNTVLEAMSSGLPVAVTGVGGNLEIVRESETGWLFGPGNVEELAQLLLRLAADREACRRAGKAARAHVEKSFSNESMIENYRSLYTDLASRKAPMNRAAGNGMGSWEKNSG